MPESKLYADTWGKEQIEQVQKLTGPILIVGVSGFIGAKLFFSLKKIRGDVYGASRDPQKNWRLLHESSENLRNLDITEYDSVKQLLQQIKPRTVFNLSAYGSYARQNDAEKIHLTNYLGTLNLLRALSELGCDAFVHAGSSSEYGLNCTAPQENDELVPNSDYAVSKVAASYLIKYYGKIHNFPCVNLRLYSIYGPWEERDRLIPSLIFNGLQQKYPPLVDKNISRDFVYVDDCNEALVKAAAVCKSQPGISINIASGQKTSLEAVALLAQEIFQIPLAPVFGSMVNRRWDLNNWVGKPQLAKTILQWEAHTPLREGLQITTEWEKQAQPILKYTVVPKTDKKLSFIIACYKDEQSIPILYERLSTVARNCGVDYEIIFVNDCSPVADERVIYELSQKDTHVVGISHSRNFGSQSAFLSGAEIASGDAVVFMDGDGQDPPEVIPEFIKKWEEGFEIVYGQRIKRTAPLYMQLLYKAFYRLFKKMADIPIPLDAGDFSLIDRKAINQILKFTERDIFLRGLRAWIGFKQVGVPYQRPERLFGISTNNFSKNIWWAKKGIFSFSVKPLYYIQIMGVAVFGMTLLLAAFYLVYYFISPPTNARGITTVILLLLGLGSIQLISMSILGDYIAKIIEEVKNRPHFIRNKIFYGGKVFEHEDKILSLVNRIRH